MKTLLKNFLKRLILVFPLRKIILLESSPDYSDNAKIFFDYLIKKKVNKKYKIIWVLNGKNNFKDIKIKNVKFISRKKNKVKFIYYNYFSKIILDSNSYIYKKRSDQFRIFLTHGTTIKEAAKYFSMVGDVDYICDIGDYFKKINSKLYNVNCDKIIATGFPRNDIIISGKSDSKKMRGSKKIIIWLPTYRQHKNNAVLLSSHFKYGVPCIENEKQLKEINLVLKKHNIELLVKLHPAQKIDDISKLGLSNFKYIDEKFLQEKRMHLYEFLSCTDALITDYSSVYYDYLLTKKPIALAIPDYNIYSKEFGFAIDYYKIIKGNYLYNFDDLIKFIYEISNDNDKFYDDRMKTARKVHNHLDNNSSKRIYNILKKHL